MSSQVNFLHINEVISTVKFILTYLELFTDLFQDQFHRHLMLEAERKEFRAIIENKSRIILVHTTSGYKYV